MVLEHTIYHAALRASGLLLALVLLFDSGLVNGVTRQLSENTQNYVATVIGVNAAVEPTELNTFTAALTAKETELEAREAALEEREIAVSLTSGESRSATPMSTYVLSVLLFIILVLITLNYILDFIRAKRLATLQNHGAKA